FLDGELTAEEHRAVEAHLRGCAACAAVLADLKRIVARAQQAGAVPRPPGADLWSGIAARIDAGQSATERSATEERSAKASAERSANVTPFTTKAMRRFAFTLPQLAAAAALVAAVSGGLVWSVVERTARRASGQLATAASPVAPAAAEPSPQGPDPRDRSAPVTLAE